MSWMLVTALLFSAPESQVRQVLATEAVTAIRGELQTGSLIVTEGDCLAVKIFSKSPYTHVAAVVIRHDEPFVYDSANGVGVRCQTLENFLKSQAPAEIHLFHPRPAFSPDCARKFESHLDAQLGRSYAIKHHLTGNTADGLHCSEYVTGALMTCQLLQARQPARVSPASLVEGILRAELYTNAATIQLVPAPEPVNAEAGWCSAMWADTKSCTRKCYLQMRGWFCCY